MNSQINPQISPASEVETPSVILHNINKTYRLDSVDVPALTDMNLLIRPNRFTVVSGASGSGKTTLLNVMGCIDIPNSGEVIVAGTAVQKLSDDELADFRAKNIGFIFQNFNLLPVLTTFENVEYPLIMAGVSPERRKRRVEKLLEAVGLADKAKNRPGQLSGGQRQRVAVARALACKPKLVLADEPTANLDSVTGTAIIRLMRRMQQVYNIAFVFSSHDPKVLAEADDSITIRDGRIVAVKRSDAHSEVTE
jgi:putative ABC transport system ATP-binding protein